MYILNPEQIRKELPSSYKFLHPFRYMKIKRMERKIHKERIENYKSAMLGHSTVICRSGIGKA